MPRDPLIGLVGKPSSGKSTTLNSLTDATSKVGAALELCLAFVLEVDPSSQAISRTSLYISKRAIFTGSDHGADSPQ